MKVVCIFLSRGPGITQLVQTILPRLEADKHGSEVVGMCCFDGNAVVLNQSEPLGQRLTKVASKNILLMIAEKTDLVYHKGQSEGGNISSGFKSSISLTPAQCTVITVRGCDQVGCFPNLRAALSDNLPDHIISL